MTDTTPTESDPPVPSIGTELPKEIARVRDEVLPAYLEVGPPGAFAVAMMRADLDRANKAMIEGSLIGMIQAYNELKGYET